VSPDWPGPLPDPFPSPDVPVVNGMLGAALVATSEGVALLLKGAERDSGWL